jgi:hypothetical protein
MESLLENSSDCKSLSLARFFLSCAALKRWSPSAMGYVVKLQKVQRPTNRSFYVNLPAALADAVQLVKGEELEWFMEDKNTLILGRRNPAKPLKLKH